MSLDPEWPFDNDVSLLSQVAVIPEKFSITWLFSSLISRAFLSVSARLRMCDWRRHSGKGDDDLTRIERVALYIWDAFVIAVFVSWYENIPRLK